MDATDKAATTLVLDWRATWERTLTAYERSEIISYEGYKPARAVALEFRITSSHVRKLWDGEE